MGRKKKRKATKSKQGIQELGGYKVGDHVWGKLYNGNVAYGEIFSLSDKNSTGHLAKIYDQINGGFRCVLLETCSMEPPKGGESKLRRAVNKNSHKHL